MVHISSTVCHVGAYITDIEVNDCRHLQFDQVDIFEGIMYIPRWDHTFRFIVGLNHLAIWHNFPDTTHIKVNNGLKLTILNFQIELTFFRAYSSLNHKFCFIVMI